MAGGETASSAHFEQAHASAQTFFRKWWRTGFGLILTVLLTLVAVRLVNWLSQPTMHGARTSIEENWNSTISSLGVSPIFPPEEDLVVGDVLAVVTNDLDADPIAQADKATKRTFVSRSVKLAHINVAPQLDDAYSSLPVFPETFPVDMKPPYRNTVARKFTDAVVLGSLPRAAFPRLKIQGIDAAAANLAATQGPATSYAAASQDFEEFELSDVRTYGLTSVTALNLLDGFCQSNADVCQEKTARQHLERVVGPRINNRYISLKSGQSEYAMTVEVVMVYRVYLTSSIVDLRRSQRERRGLFSFSALWPFGNSEPARNTTPAQPAPSSSATPETDPVKILVSKVDELQRKVSSIQNGTALGYGSFFGNESSLEGRFERPVAIGYRSVKMDFASEKPKE
jgi:hypothetical protein